MKAIPRNKQAAPKVLVKITGFHSLDLLSTCFFNLRCVFFSHQKVGRPNKNTQRDSNRGHPPSPGQKEPWFWWIIEDITPPGEKNRL